MRLKFIEKQIRHGGDAGGRGRCGIKASRVLGFDVWLDDDVAVLLKQVQTRRKISLRETVNNALRTGLIAMTSRRKRARRSARRP